MKALSITGQIAPAAYVLSCVPVPTINPDQVLVKIRAAGINPIDWQTIEYGFFDMLGLSVPYTMGYDIAGVVEKVGENVSGFKAGDEVMGSLAISHPGSFAEYAAADAQILIHKPEALSFAEAAAVTLAGETAYQALFDHLQIQPGQKVLIQAAAGGVGIFAVQLALQTCAYVVAVGSNRNTDFLKALGADEVVDYHAGFGSLSTDFDAILDSMNSAEQTLPLLKKGGKYVSITQPASADLAEKHQVTATHFLYTPNAAHLQELVSRIGKSQLQIYIDKTFALNDINEGINYQKNGHTRGKNVIIVE
ncbi:NADP-dependent oxidoreductase [Mucilaginibacter jinjuensis]|uniref:NADP-dependent oxidoreductase n=1 Tax=Mucilaginibacter jinjuensis TaxID=1176721 RepID=A0ABY7TBC7_9SPHI|nr:NADP-dependent oxidoreductase [Mucilaginibacter jinjuensis]WCT13756.1 NADP-dependent oxidoreductase [Mucilaginibacter jinjuensis]